ncbi:DUF397 domain-containing protein [Streptomyces sp. 8N706]|uniref:DUF397 domain-containing protein n=1 Tax=Streptomyces sp. 8N706 TaxID=3457416 RepID=UPI003FD3A9B4
MGEVTVSEVVSERNGLEWIRASDSSEEHCIEVAAGEGDLIHIRYSDDPDTVVTTTAAKWRAFVLGVRNDEFDHFVEGAAPPRTEG